MAEWVVTSSQNGAARGGSFNRKTTNWFLSFFPPKMSRTDYCTRHGQPTSVKRAAFDPQPYLLTQRLSVWPSLLLAWPYLNCHSGAAPHDFLTPVPGMLDVVPSCVQLVSNGCILQTSVTMEWASGFYWFPHLSLTSGHKVSRVAKGSHDQPCNHRARNESS